MGKCIFTVQIAPKNQSGLGDDSTCTQSTVGVWNTKNLFARETGGAGLPRIRLWKKSASPWEVWRIVDLANFGEDIASFTEKFIDFSVCRTYPRLYGRQAGYVRIWGRPRVCREDPNSRGCAHTPVWTGHTELRAEPPVIWKNHSSISARTNKEYE